MFDRKLCKTKGKKSFKRNYLICVLAAFIISALCDGMLSTTVNMIGTRKDIRNVASLASQIAENKEYFVSSVEQIGKTGETIKAITFQAAEELQEKVDQVQEKSSELTEKVDAAAEQREQIVSEKKEELQQKGSELTEKVDAAAEQREQVVSEKKEELQQKGSELTEKVDAAAEQREQVVSEKKEELQQKGSELTEKGKENIVQYQEAKTEMANLASETIDAGKQAVSDYAVALTEKSRKYTDSIVQAVKECIQILTENYEKAVENGFDPNVLTQLFFGNEDEAKIEIPVWLVTLAGVFLFAVIDVGGRSFFIINRTDNAKLSELFSMFSNGNYWKCVETMFLMKLKNVLWCLLLIVPGIIKKYEYAMIPYILADNKKLSCGEAFTMSKKMMKGNKWKLFVFELSFIGWDLLSLLTANILGFLFVFPYKKAALAEVYQTLKHADSNVLS